MTDHRFSPVYFDANATEILRPAARQAALKGMEQEGNPASVHYYGRQARCLLEDARKSIAHAFGSEADACIFTSGGTEADTLAIHALGRAEGRRILVGATEHDAVRCAAPEAEILPVDHRGLLRLEVLREVLHNTGPALVCVMAANNETGICSPLSEIAALCREKGALLHIDAVQGAGRMVLPLEALEGASFAISGHKMGGPKGAGALILPHDRPLLPLCPGGGQERGRRGGTPGLPALLGMAVALQESQKQDWASIAALRDVLQQKVCDVGGEIVGEEVPRLPNTLNVILPGITAQTQLMTLDLAGFCVSAGSACSSGKVTASHVLRAMGLGEKAEQAIRISLPWNVRPDEVQAFGETYAAMAHRLLKGG